MQQLTLFTIVTNDGDIHDWYDGSYSQQIIKYSKANCTTIYLSIATDGLALFKTRSSGLWPFCCTILNMNPLLRKELEHYIPVSVMELAKGQWSDLLQLLFFKEIEYLHINSMFIFM